MDIMNSPSARRPPANLPNHQPAHLLSHLPAHLPAQPRVHLPACLTDCPPACPTAYMSACLPICLFAWKLLCGGSDFCLCVHLCWEGGYTVWNMSLLSTTAMATLMPIFLFYFWLCFAYCLCCVHTYILYTDCAVVSWYAGLLTSLHRLVKVVDIPSHKHTNNQTECLQIIVVRFLEL